MLMGEPDQKFLSVQRVDCASVYTHRYTYEPSHISEH